MLVFLCNLGGLMLNNIQNQDAQQRLDHELNTFMKVCCPKRKEHKKLLSLVDAIKNRNALYVAEPWVTQSTEVVANEMLFRFRDGSKKVLSYSHVEKDLICANLLTGFDLVNLFNILSWVPSQAGDTACTVNLNHDTLTSPEICKKITEAMAKRDGPQIVIEILEDDRLFTAEELKSLSAMKNSGIQFALDDFRFSHASDWQRLDGLKDIVSYVKLDGKDSVRPYLDNKAADINTLFQRVAQIHNQVGADKKIIAEWVQTPDEAHKLFNKGVYAVQGHNLVF